MADFQVARLLQNPLGQPAPAGHRGDIVRVSNEWATIYLDPNEFERTSEAGLQRMLVQSDTRPLSVVGVSTPAGGRGVSIHVATSLRASSVGRSSQNGPVPPGVG
jgi:hypothetical protein